VAQLSGARSGPGSGRIYTITAECVDGSGNTEIGTVEVKVPHSKIAGTVSGDMQAGDTISLYKASCGTDLLVETAIIDSKGNYGFELPLLRGTYTFAPQNPDYNFGPELIEVMITELRFLGPYDFTTTTNPSCGE
jgi:hypothetical protein